MSLVKDLDAVLAPMNIESFPDFYAGTDIDYLVYNDIVDSPDNFADDEPQNYVRSANVNLYVRTNREKKKKQLRRLLRAADFSLGDTIELHESETGYTHYVVSVEDCIDADDSETEE